MHLLKAKRGMNIVKIVIEVIIVVVLLPVMTVQIATATNLSATTVVIFGLFELFVAIGVLYSIGKDTGIIKSSQ